MKKLSKLLIFAAYSVLAWSWLLVVDVGKISPDRRVAFAIALLMLILTSGLVIGVYWVALRLFDKHKSPNLLKNAGLILLIWPLTEFLASWLPNMLWYGRGGSVDTLAPFTTFSLIIAHTPLAYLFRFFGLFGTSAIVVATVYLLTHKQSRRAGYLALVGIGVFGAMCYFLYIPHGQRATVGATRQNVSNQVAVTPTQASLVVLPEYGLSDMPRDDIATRIAPAGHEVFYVGSLADRREFPEKNMLIHGSTTAGFLSQQQKYRLIPGGEYLAYIHIIPLRLINDKTIIPTFEFSRATQKGHNPVHQYAYNDELIVGSGDCSSIIAPQDYRHMTKSGASLLTNSASLDVFNNSRLYAWETNSMAQFIAIANARAFVQSANDGDSFILNSSGQTIAALHANGYVEKTVTLNTKKTPYTYLGEWCVWVSGVGLAFIELKRLVRRRSSTR